MDASVPRPRYSTPIAAALRVAALALAAMLAANARAAAPATDVFNVELVVFRYNGTVASPENWDARRRRRAVAARTAESNGRAPSRTRGASGPTAQSRSVPALGHRGRASTQCQLPAARAFRLSYRSRRPGSRNTRAYRDHGGCSERPDRAPSRSSAVDFCIWQSISRTRRRIRCPRCCRRIRSRRPVAFQMHQDRRMRPFERHYFDHPAFGVVAIITPVRRGRAAATDAQLAS